jgi:hypothetical protein
VQTRTRNALLFATAAVLTTAGAVWLARDRLFPQHRLQALDAVPNGALLVATADLDALRASPSGGPFLKEGREIPGIGKVRDVCGFDPIDSLNQVAIAVPAAGDTGEFGLVASGGVDDDALIACATKIIEARGGRPIVTTVGSFRTVRDGSLATTGGEIAVRKNGPLLLGAGAYMRAMIDTADGHTPAIHASVGHSYLQREVGEGSVRVTVVLTPEQRQTLADELRTGGAASSPATSVVAGALSINLGEPVAVHGLIACEEARACGELAEVLKSRRDELARDVATRLVGFGALLERLEIAAKGEQIHARCSIPAMEATALLDRLMTLRGIRHPMPGDSPRRMPAPPGNSSPAPPERPPGDTVPSGRPEAVPANP